MIKSYFTIKIQYLKTALEFPLNFWLMVLSGFVIRYIFYIVIYILYSNVLIIPGWSQYDLYLVLAFMFITEGLCNLLFDGVWKIPSFIFEGKLDTYITRPASIIFQILASDIGLQGIGILGVGVLLFVKSAIHFEVNIFFVFFSIVAIICGTMIRLSVNLTYNSLAFWFHSPSINVGHIVNSIGDFSKYPLKVYPKWIQLMLVTIIPYAWFTTLTVDALKKDFNIYWIILVVFTCAALFFACRIFYSGLRKYESVGG